MNALAKTAYVAGKYADNAHGGNWVQNAMYLVRAAGYSIPYNWQADIRPNKPYLDDANVGGNRDAAADMLRSAFDAHLFVLVVEGNLYGAMAEFGAALASKRMWDDKRIIITFVPDSDPRQSVFFAAEGVEVVQWDDLPNALTASAASSRL